MAEEVQHQPGQKRFVLQLGDQEAELTYTLAGGMLRVDHTGVPPSLEHRGLASRLAEAAIAYAREQRLVIQPRCRFMAVYLKRHPEHQALVAPSS